MNDTKARERAFWDEHASSLKRSLHEYHAGPDPNTAAMFEALEPLDGMQVLDFACGTGVTSAWLAARGAEVTGLDLSPRSIERANELRAALGTTARFVVGDVDSLADLMFDRLAGRFALHHVDCVAVAPLLAVRLRPGGAGAFLETMATNPLLRLARRHLVGRLGIPRIGTHDEQPLGETELAALKRAFGDLRVEVGEMMFLRIFDRQVLQYRSPRAARALGHLDDLLLKLDRRSWSYHQVLVVRRSAGA